jgi:hypothetical protein
MDREVRLYIQGHAFKMEGEKYGFFPVDVTSAWMELFPTYHVDGDALSVERVGGSDMLMRAFALLQKERALRVPERPLEFDSDHRLTLEQPKAI